MAVSKRVRKNPKGKNVTTYQAEVWINKVRVASQSFPTRAAADRWHEAEKARRTGGVLAVTLRDVVAAYRREHLPTVDQATTRRAIETRLVHVDNAPLADVSLQHFDDKVIDQWISWLIEQPTAQRAGRKSFKGEVDQLSIVLTWWRETHNAVFVNPVVKRHRKRAIYKPMTERRPDYYVRPEDVRMWLDDLRQIDEPVYARIAMFQVLTGCRIGEVMALDWSVVDLGARQAHIHRTAMYDNATNSTLIKDKVKTAGSNRVVRLSPDLVALLESIPGPRTGAVFKLLSGKLPIYHLVKYRYNQAFKRLGLPWKATHIARHTWATLGLLANGGNTAAVQAALGHTSPTQTMRYAKVVAHMADSTADKVSSLVHVNPTYDDAPPAKVLAISKA